MISCDFMPERDRRFKKRSQKIQSIQDKRKQMQKENAAAEEEVSCRIKSRKIGRQMQIWQRNFTGCR